MIIFWIAATLLCTGAAVLMFRGAARVGPALAEDPALGVHRRQLSEIDDLAERGLLAEDEKRAARAEAGRRLLDAAEADMAAPAAAAGPFARRLVLILGAGAPLLAIGLYATVAGSPGDPDQPFAKRVAAWQANPETLGPQEMAAVLTTIVAKHPDSPEAWKRLGMAQLMADDAASSEAALRKAVTLAPGDPEAWVLLGEAFSKETGSIGTDSVFALNRARAIIAPLAAGDPERQRIEGAIAEVEQSVAPQAQVDANAQAAAAAGGVSPQMIQAMVASLAQRLKTTPDDPEGWVRLVRAYTVLGDTAKRDAALAEARQRFAARPDVLAELNQAAGAPAK